MSNDDEFLRELVRDLNELRCDYIEQGNRLFAWKATACICSLIGIGWMIAWLLK